MFVSGRFIYKKLERLFLGFADFYRLESDFNYHHDPIQIEQLDLEIV